MAKPISRRCSNTHFDDRWTCPGCYNDLPNKREGAVVCTACGASVTCTLERVPECVSEIVDADDDEGGRD